ncbi:sensor histidine kinase [Lacinutrix jangbogonensis]|uniref:sensor histidine kinase n=1 Tax=Lacinutrix jangbogonensis TaxID=1469557 RepID=UPI00053E531E|nr:sensor histidine kinase [Lacinutrix jangbogonensis]
MKIKLKNGCFIKRYLYSILLPILLFSMIIGCNTTDEIKIPEEFALLEKRENFKDSLYEITFSKAYKKYLDKKEYPIVAKLLMVKGNALDYYLKYDSIYLKQSVNFITKHNTVISENQNMEIRYFIGSQYDFESNVTESKKWLLNAITYSKNPEQETMVGFSHLILASLYRQTSKLDSSQLHAFKALKVFEITKDTTNISTIQYNLFRISSSINDTASATKALDEMIRYGKAVKDTVNICLAFTSHANNAINTDTTYQNVNKYSDSLDHYIKHWSDPVPTYLFKNSLIKANIYLHNKDITNAEKEAIKADSLINPSSYFANYQMDNLKLNLEYAKNGSYNKERFTKMLTASKKYEDYSRAVGLLADMVASKEKAKDYSSAFFYLKDHNSMRDSLWNNDLKSKIYEFEKKYQTAKKEQKIIEQKNTLLQRNSIIGFLGFSILAAGLGFMVYANQRKKLRLKKEYELQEDYTKQLLQNTEHERSRIAGDLHDSVNHKLLQLSSKAKQGELVTFDEFTTVIEQVRNISHNLHPAMFEKVGLEKSIDELARNLMDTTPLQITTQLSYIKVLSTQQELQIYRIVEEALNNIIKHSKASHALIKIVSTESKLEVKIKDNGEGFDTNKLKDNKNSFGLMNIEQRSKTIKGIFNIISSKKGTELGLTIKT